MSRNFGIPARQATQHRPRLISEYWRAQFWTGAAFVLAACLVALCVRYPDGFVVWQHGHLSFDFNR